MKRSLLIAGCVASAACTHTHLQRNAPGHIDVMTPPADLATGETEVPTDPGERMLVLSYGGFATAGYASAGSRFDYAVGPEVALSLGDRPTSHYEDDFFLLPARSLGMRFGVSAIDGERSGAGPAYAELAVSDKALRVSAGLGYDINDERYGPQATAAVGPFLLRATHLVDFGTTVHAGLLLMGSHTWVWSQ